MLRRDDAPARVFLSLTPDRVLARRRARRLRPDGPLLAAHLPRESRLRRPARRRRAHRRQVLSARPLEPRGDPRRAPLPRRSARGGDPRLRAASVSRTATRCTRSRASTTPSGVAPAAARPTSSATSRSPSSGACSRASTTSGATSAAPHRPRLRFRRRAPSTPLALPRASGLLPRAVPARAIARSVESARPTLRRRSAGVPVHRIHGDCHPRQPAAWATRAGSSSTSTTS